MYQEKNEVIIIAPKYNNSLETFRYAIPRGHSITKHTGGLARRSKSKTPNYLSKNSNIRKVLKSYPLNILRYSPRAQRLAIWDKFSFSLRIVPLIIHMNIFSYPQLLFKLIFLKNPKISFNNQNPRPQTIEPGLPYF